MNNEIAILMAAGMGERMQPLTLKTPKPLIKVHGTPMIETVVSALEQRGVSHLYVVTGYLKEQFEYLKDKYKNITLIENNEYLKKNNISSIYSAKDILGNSDCFICETDLYIPDTSIFAVNLKKSCYYGKMMHGHSDDWVFNMKGDRIIEICKHGDNVYNMVGISYFKKNDAKIISEAVIEAYKHNGHEKLYWDEIVNLNLNNIYLSVCPVLENSIYEIDSIKELASIDSMYNNIIDERV